ncbi:ABC transporter permease [bacterium]|nr:ABC transporter permease [bacterium]
MIKHYLSMAMRMLKKSPGTAWINICGLTIGSAAFLFILIYVQFEQSYDQVHPEYQRLYRLRIQRFTEDGQASRFASCAPPAGLRIRDQLPEADLVARCVRYKASVSYRDNAYLEDRLYFAEAELLKALYFNPLNGDWDHALSVPNQAIISRSTAERYFGKDNAVGKVIQLDKKMSFKVVAVFEDTAPNVHIKFDMLLSYHNLLDIYGESFENAWGHTGVFTYLRLKEGANLQNMKMKLEKLVDAEFGEALKYYNMSMELVPDPVTSIHLNSHHMQEVEVNGNSDSVQLLFFIGVFILFMAWVNYINLATARSMTRAKEIGLRKVVGAKRSQLIAQIFTEAALMNGLAIALSLVIVLICLPFVETITYIPLRSSFAFTYEFAVLIICMYLISIVFSGLYPSLILTGFRPVAVLKGSIGRSAHGRGLRKVLVVFQFIIAIAIMTGTFAVQKQIGFMQSQSLGVKIDQTMVVRSPRVRGNAVDETFKTFKDQLLSNKFILNVCHVTEVPGRQIYWDAGAIMRKGQDANQGKTYHIMGVDADFVDFFSIQLAAGRSFSLEHSSDHESILLNKTACKLMGFEIPEQAVGQQVQYWDKFYTIIGVVDDYHQQSVKMAFEPILYRYMPTGRDIRGQFAVRIDVKDQDRTIESIQNMYDKFFPGNAFEHFFLDEYFDQQYHTDELVKQILAFFALIALCIAVLGVLGLSAFDTTQRRKEIGIRKVMGGSVLKMVWLLISEFFLLMGYAVVITIPVIFWGLGVFLKQYAFRMSITADLFAWPILLLVFSTVAFMIWQITGAAMANPVKSLRYE